MSLRDDYMLLFIIFIFIFIINSHISISTKFLAAAPIQTHFSLFTHIKKRGPQGPRWVPSI